MRLRTSLVVCALFTATAARAAAETAAEERPVTVSATAYLYLVPGAPNFVMVVAPVDIRRVHVFLATPGRIPPFPADEVFQGAHRLLVGGFRPSNSPTRSRSRRVAGGIRWRG